MENLPREFKFGTQDGEHALMAVNQSAEMEAPCIPEKDSWPSAANDGPVPGPSRNSTAEIPAMDADLLAVKAVLAELTNAELQALIAATYGVPQTAPGLLAWIDGACDWEVKRRRDFDYPLQPPEAAIHPSEDEVSISAAIVLRDQFAQDSRAVRAFFDALVGLLIGAGDKH